MILPVYLYGHPVLRREAETLEADSAELQKLIADMWETMYHSDGVGFPECAGSKMCLINPEIEVDEDTEVVSREEGCLSLPGLSENVKRHEKLRMRWLDENFKEHEGEFSGFLARIIQHEFDHLLGKVYIDHVSPIRKQLIRSKLNNIVKGKVACEYRVKSATK